MEFLQNLGVPDDKILLLKLLFTNVLLGFAHHLVKTYKYRIAYSLICGLVVGFIQFGFNGLIHFAISSITVYCFMLILGQKQQGLTCGLLTTLFSLGYLAAIHLHRQIYYYNSWHIDSSMLQMLLTPKLMIIAFTYQDGAKLPNLFEYYAYLCHYGGFLVGPVFEYKPFIVFCLNEKPPNFGRCVKTSLYLWVRGLISSVLFFVVANIFFPIKYAITDEYAQRQFWQKFVYFNISGHLLRFQFYAGWSFSDASIAASGLSYNHEKDDFTLIRGCDMKKEEFGITIREIGEGWNAAIQQWLKNFVYIRLINSKFSQAQATGLTFVVSAIWHGFYPVYYFTFFQWFFFTQVGVFWFKIQKLHEKSKSIKYWDIYFVFLHENVRNYALLCHYLLDWDDAVVFMKVTYFYGFFIIASAYMITKFALMICQQKKKHEISKKEGENKELKGSKTQETKKQQ